MRLLRSASLVVIKPLAYNQSMVSGHLDKNDAKDIEKIKDKLTKQDNNSYNSRCREFKKFTKSIISD